MKLMEGFNFTGLCALIIEDQTDQKWVLVILHSFSALNAIEEMHVNHGVF